MISIDPASINGFQVELARFVKESEERVATSAKGLTAAAVAHIVPRTAQWSGDMVTQWHIGTHAGTLPSYSPSGWAMEEGAWRDLIFDGPYSVRNPNESAILEVREQLSRELHGRPLESWLFGAVIGNSHPHFEQTERAGRSLVQLHLRQKTVAHLLERFPYIYGQQYETLKRYARNIPWHAGTASVEGFYRGVKVRATAKKERVAEARHAKRVAKFVARHEKKQARAAEVAARKRAREEAKAARPKRTPSAQGAAKKKVGRPLGSGKKVGPALSDSPTVIRRFYSSATDAETVAAENEKALRRVSLFGQLEGLSSASAKKTEQAAKRRARRKK